MATKPAARPLASSIALRSLIVLILVNILNFYDRQVPGALVEPMRREFGLSDAQIGWIGTAFTLLYAVIGLPLGRIADRGSRDRKSTRLNSSHPSISYAVFCLKKK